MTTTKKISIYKRVWFWLLCLILLGFALPQRFVIPVLGANKGSYHQKSFWYYPWGRSGVHKGVDIFAKEGTGVVSTTHGMVIYIGEISMGGNVVLVLGPKWRIHYYAHLKEINTRVFSWTSPGELIGSVGTTGNAKGKAPHLHYSIATLIPYFWQVDGSVQGLKKMFYVNPIPYLNAAR